MKLLAIDTATEACSAAVWHDGVIHERFEIAPQRHAELILPMMEAVLAAAGLKLADMDGLAVGRGPGAFTGVRIAIGVIQGVALGTGLRVATVSSLAALAQGCMRDQSAPKVIAAFDARMAEVYVAAYTRDATGHPQPAFTEEVCPPAQAPAVNDDGWLGAGTGFSACEGALANHYGDQLQGVLGDCYPRARDVALLAVPCFERGETVDAAHALPVYLRNQVAKRPST